MSKELQNLINGLSPDNFKTLVKEYLKEKYKTPNVRIIDGPYDGGNDVEITKDNRLIKKNIQVTVQKNYEKKLEVDVKKAKENANKHGYLRTLDFYISQTLTKSMRDELETSAEINHEIDLNIIDARILSEEAENYPSIKRVTYEAFGLVIKSEPTKVSKESKILFDVLTLDRNTVEIKKNLINSLIFSFLYSNPKASLEDIYSYIDPVLQNSVDQNFIFKELNYLKSKHYIISEEKGTYSLEKNKYDEIAIIYQNVELEEGKLNKILDDFRAENSIKCEIIELHDILKKIYDENYEIDISEISRKNNSFSSALRRSFSDLENFFKRKDCSKEDSTRLAKVLFARLADNDYLNKISTTRLFTNLYSNDGLDKYISNKKANVLLDTQVLIRILGIIYKEDFEYRDYALRSVRSLIHTFEHFQSRLNLLTTYDYIEEVAGHIQDALRLQPFLNLPFIESLGTSKNVYFNLFRRFSDAGVIEETQSLEEFISELLNIELPEISNDEFIQIVSEKLVEIFETFGMEIINHPLYDDYQDVKKAYEIDLAFAGRERTYTAREHDLRTMLYLSDPNNHTDINTGDVNEPFLVTWDSAFYSFRKDFLNRFKKKRSPNYWYIYSPLKFIDRFSVMNFQVNPKALTYNIIALAETNFNYSTKTVSFIDVISSLFHVEDISQLGVIHKLTELKNSTQEIDYVESDDTINDSAESPVTFILLELRNYYSSFESKNNLQSLVGVFENNIFQDKIISILKEAVKEYKLENDIKHILKKFDVLIKENAR